MPHRANLAVGSDPLRWLRSLLVLAPIASALAAVLSSHSAGALPLFARRYAVPCTQCHFAFPRLNTFGMAFRQNGYRMAGEKGSSPWQSREFPLSAVVQIGYGYTSVDSADSAGRRTRSALATFDQEALEIHSAGTLGPRISHRVDANFDGAGGPLDAGMAFVQFDDVMRDGRLNIKVGIFDADIPYLADSRRVTLAEYLSPITLDGRGIELNGVQRAWVYALGVIDSERSHGKPGSRTLNQLENPYAWIMGDFAGQLVTARVLLDRQDPRDTTQSAANHLQAELNAFFNCTRWIVIPGVTYEHFDQADLTQRDRRVTLLLEGHALLDKKRRVLATARYELRHSPRFTFHGVPSLPEEDATLEVGNLSYYVNPNLRVALEYSHAQDNHGGPRTDAAQLFVHLGY